MRKVMNTLKALWKDESAQGATEYILLLVIVVTLALIFRSKIKSIVETKMGELGDSIGAFKPEGGS